MQNYILVFSLLLCTFSQKTLSQTDLSKVYADIGYKWADSSWTIEELDESFWNKNDFTIAIQTHFLNKELDSIKKPMVGVLSDKYQRFQFLIESVFQDEKLNNWYYIHGKTTHLGETRKVSGKIKYKSATLYSSENNSDALCLIAEFEAHETEDLPYTGNFKGIFKIIIIDPIIEDNEFDYFPDDQIYETGAEKAVVGTWVEKNNKFSLPFVIGFERIPYQFAPDFDLGDGEMCINKKYSATWFEFTKEQKLQHAKESSDCINIHSGGFKGL